MIRNLLLTVLFAVVFVWPTEAANVCAVPSQYSSIQTAIDDVACSEIEIAAGIYGELLLIDRDVIISGAALDQTTIQPPTPDVEERIIEITGTPTVELKNLTVAGGHDGDGGGIYQAGGMLTLRFVRLYDNFAFAYGGGIYAAGELYLYDVVVDENIAQYRGGGIYAANNLVAERILVQNNHAMPTYSYTDPTSRYGGGIYIRANVDKSAEITNATIQGNSSVHNGGGIYTYNPLTLRNAYVYSNTTTSGYGGGISLVRGSHYVADSTFIENNATSSSNVNAGGGAISVGGGSLSHTTIVRSYFARNRSTQRAGAIALGGTNLTISDSGFEHNVAEAGNGGAIDVHWSSLELERIGMTGNTAQNGGAISGKIGSSSSSGSIRIDQALLNNNVAHQSGGAIFSQLDSLTVSNTSVQDNTAANNGGGIYVSTVTNAVLSALNISRNQANNGGGIYAAGETLVQNGSIDNNGASESGGGVFVTSAATKFEGGRLQIVDNQAGLSGGGLFTAAPIVLREFLVGNNIAGENGGGIATSNKVAAQLGAVFGNVADGFGGGLYLMGSPTVSNIANSSFGENQGQDGSEIYSDSAINASFMSIGFSQGSNSAIYKVDSAETITFSNVLIDAIANNPQIVNCGGATAQIVGVNSYDSDGTCFGNRTQSNLMLEPLADNGGYALTFKLQTGSPAINAGTDCPTVDARGFLRPAASCDIGAYQTAAVPTAVTLSQSAANTQPFIVIYLSLFLALSYLTVITHTRHHSRN